MKKTLQIILVLFGAFIVAPSILIVGFMILLTLLDDGPEVLTDIKDYNKQQLIEENHADLHSYFKVFPDDVEKAKETSFISALDPNLAGTTGVVILEVSYSENDYQVEVDRISNISCTLEGLNDKTITQEIIYDESMYNYPAFIAADGNCGTYEYALLDEDNHKINYALINYPNDEQLKQYKNLVKKDTTEYDDSGTNTWKYFSIYAYQFPGDDGLTVYDGE